MTKNDIMFIEKVVNLDTNIANAQEYIKETYGVDSTYNAENGEIVLETKNVLKAASAKKYLDSNFNEDFIDTVFE